MPRILYNKYRQIILLARDLRKNATPSEKLLWNILRRKNLLKQKEYDFDRDSKLSDKGIYVLRIKNEELGDKGYLIMKINETINARKRQIADNKQDIPFPFC